jgi:drug/metabolite transporter (DMT)-like permease
MPIPTVLPLLCTLVLWAAAFPAIRAALASFTPGQLGFLRFSIASLTLAAVWLRRRPPLPKRNDLLGLLALGAVGIGGYNLALNTGSLTVPSGTAGLLVNTAPIWTAAAASAFLGERADWHVWAGLAVAFSGAALIALRHGGGVEINHGAALVLVASLCHATYITLQKKYVSTYGAFGVTCYAVWVGAATLAPFAGGAAGALGAAGLRGALILLFLGVGPAAVAYLMWARVLSRLDASHAVGFLFFVPVGAFVIGWLWLGEVPTARTVVGGVLVLAGVALVNLRRAVVGFRR